MFGACGSRLLLGLVSAPTDGYKAGTRRVQSAEASVTRRPAEALACRLLTTCLAPPPPVCQVIMDSISLTQSAARVRRQLRPRVSLRERRRERVGLGRETTSPKLSIATRCPLTSSFIPFLHSFASDLSRRHGFNRRQLNDALKHLHRK